MQPDPKFLRDAAVKRHSAGTTTGKSNSHANLQIISQNARKHGPFPKICRHNPVLQRQYFDTDSGGKAAFMTRNSDFCHAI